ncbi:MAG: hypothetical protein ACO4CT_05180 [Planctomycetota bacterium]|jgi:hypothetical protein
MQVRTFLSVFALAATASAQTPGYFLTSGEGCPNASLLYEQFAPGAFDLSGGPSLDWVPNGADGFIVTRGLATFLPIAGGTNVGATDDSVTGPWPLGFSFPHPGGLGTTTAIDISANGYVYLEPGSIAGSRCCDAASRIVRIFRQETPSWAAFGTDLNPALGGTVWINQTPNVTYVTWENVPEEQSSSINTFQIQFYPFGQVSLVYQQTANLLRSALVGWSAGGGVDDDGSYDLSSATVYNMGPSSGPLTISAQPGQVPVVGSPFQLDISNVPSNVTFGALLNGAQPQNLALDVFGADGCSLLVSPDNPAFPLNLTSPSGSLTIPLPSLPSLLGFTLEMQAVVLAPGINSLGLATSNRGSMTIGNTRPVVVRAHGLDNQNDDESIGFWQVINATQIDITRVQFDWVRAAQPNGIYFDTNEIGMRDRFDGGNSRTALCNGTYRNGSDLAVGLDYANSNASPCGANSRTGFTMSNFFGAAGSVRTLDFRFTSFTPGLMFEFDADTDGGPGDGASMAGMKVTVWLSDGTTRTGFLTQVGPETSMVSL